MTCACPDPRDHDLSRTFVAFVDGHVRAELDGDDPAALDPLLDQDGDRRYAVDVSCVGASVAHRLAHMIGRDERVQHLRPAQVLTGSALIMASNPHLTDRALDLLGDAHVRSVVHNAARFVARALIELRGPDRARGFGRELIAHLAACDDGRNQEGTHP